MTDHKSRVEIVRAKERWKIKPHTSSGDTLGYRYEALAYHMSDKMMMPYCVEIPARSDEKVELSKHDGEEFLYVLSGKIEANIDSKKHVLSQGDALYFDPSLEHSFCNREQQVAKILVCLINKKDGASTEDPFDRAFGS